MQNFNPVFQDILPPFYNVLVLPEDPHGSIGWLALTQAFKYFLETIKDSFAITACYLLNLKLLYLQIKKYICIIDFNVCC